VQLFVTAGKPEEAVAFLKTVKPVNREFLEFAALFALKAGFVKEATAWADQLSAEDRAQKASAERLRRSAAIQALIMSETDLELAEDRVSRFAVPKLSEAELDALEASTKLPEVKEEKAEVAVAVAQAFGVEGVKKRRRIVPGMTVEKIKKIKDRKRKRRRLQKPRNYDPSKIPDPERWTPMNKRTGKRKKKAVVNQPKGGAAGQGAKKAPAKGRRK
jgi:signal recognition particle subunit SRP72